MKESKDYVRGYTDALNHTKYTLLDLTGQIEAVTNEMLDKAFEEEETKEDKAFEEAREEMITEE